MAPDNTFGDSDIFEELCKRCGVETDLATFTQRLGNHIASKITIPPKAGCTNKLTEQAHSNMLRVSIAPQLFDAGERISRCQQAGQLARKAHIRINPTDAQKRSITHESSVSLRSQGGVLTTSAMIDPGVSQGTVVIPYNLADFNISELDPSWFNGFSVDVQPIL